MPNIYYTESELEEMMRAAGAEETDIKVIYEPLCNNGEIITFRFNDPDCFDWCSDISDGHRNGEITKKQLAKGLKFLGSLFPGQDSIEVRISW